MDGHNFEFKTLSGDSRGSYEMKCSCGWSRGWSQLDISFPQADRIQIIQLEHIVEVMALKAKIGITWVQPQR